MSKFRGKSSYTVSSQKTKKEGRGYFEVVLKEIIFED
jgi:hypothetical protein